MIEAVCPRCARVCHFEDDQEGREGKCLTCGQRFVLPQPVVWETSAENDRPTVVPRTEISQKNPTCLLFLVDQSGSMSNKFGFAGPRKDCVADTINRFLYNMAIRCTSETGIRDYFHVALYGYGGELEIADVFQGIKPISWVADNVQSVEKRLMKQISGVELETDLPIWILPQAKGYTPMATAFEAAYRDLCQWQRKYPNSFPPIVFNITDGAYTDRNPTKIVRQIMSLRTNAGNAMVMNCHIAGGGEPPIFFPNNSEMQRKNGLDRQLYQMSSVLPTSMVAEANLKGYKASEGARGFAFNADLVMLVDFFDLGSKPVVEIDLIPADSKPAPKKPAPPSGNEVDLVPSDSPARKRPNRRT